MIKETRGRKSNWNKGTFDALYSLIKDEKLKLTEACKQLNIAYSTYQRMSTSEQRKSIRDIIFSRTEEGILTKEQIRQRNREKAQSMKPLLLSKKLKTENKEVKFVKINPNLTPIQERVATRISKFLTTEMSLYKDHEVIKELADELNSLGFVTNNQTLGLEALLLNVVQFIQKLA